MYRAITITTLLVLSSLALWGSRSRSTWSNPAYPTAYEQHQASWMPLMQDESETSGSQDDQEPATQPTSEDDALPEVAESSIKVQMGIVFEPSFDRLRTWIGSEADAAKEVQWREVQGDALILSEFMGRIQQWPELSAFEDEKRNESFRQHLKDVKAADVKSTATELYQAVKVRDLERSKALFVELAERCNNCHAASSSWVPVVLKP